MASYFASRGMDVLMTDLNAVQAAVKGWSQTSQHAPSREAAYRPELVSRECFDANVRHQVVDMNAVPEVPQPHDFCWSICAMEHLGSIDAGLAFVENSLKVVKPGGLAIHTTEYNYLSQDHTREHGEVVLFLRKHLEELDRRLRASGYYPCKGSSRRSSRRVPRARRVRDAGSPPKRRTACRPRTRGSPA